MNFRGIIVLTTLLIATLGSGCGSGTRDLENYGAVGPLSLTNHPSGYGRRTCLMCHNASLNLHRATTTTINADSLNQQVQQYGTSICMGCHGSNGVTTP